MFLLFCDQLISKINLWFLGFRVLDNFFGQIWPNKYQNIKTKMIRYLFTHHLAELFIPEFWLEEKRILQQK